jgi:release factor glutamine methyltransferase
VRIDAALKQARAQLGNKFSAALDARLLMQEATGFSHADIIASPEREVSGEALAKFNAFLARRLAHEPVSRILGRREFYGRNFMVTPDVLDPRSETEVVVELALKLVKAGRFIDLGTGSGAIAVTLCAENEGLSGIASDISPAAIKVAQANAAANNIGARLKFHQGNWLENLDETYDLIISNPPYIRSGDTLMPEVFGHDPHIALFAGHDGLEAYRLISASCGARLATNGIIVVEVGAGQDTEVRQLFETKGLALLESAEDLQGHTRALAFSLREPS